MYVRLEYPFDEAIEVQEYHSARYGAPGQKRQPKKKATPEEIKKHNQYNRIRKIRRLIRWNFKPDDYWLTITYRKDERPSDMETAAHDAKLLLNRLRTEYKKAGKEMKWILKTEIGSRGGIHHHLLINRIPNLDAIMSKKWKKGGVYIRLTYSEGGYKKLADYIAKQDGKEYRYTRSRNLVKRDPVRTKMKGKTFMKAPRPRKGYVIDPESFTEGVNPLGYPWREYELIRIRTGTNYR